MPSGIEFPKEKRAEILALLAQGKKLREISEATGVAWQTIYGWRDRDEQFRLDYDTAKSVYRRYKKDLAEERRDYVADELYAQAERLKVDNPDAYTTLLLKLHELHEKQIQKLELSSDPERPVVVAHERRYTLADMLNAARAIPGLEPGARRELPAASEVLAEPAEGQPAASDLSVRHS